MRKVIVTAYKYNEESSTLVDRYICIRYFKIIKEEIRRVVGKRNIKNILFLIWG